MNARTDMRAWARAGRRLCSKPLGLAAALWLCMAWAFMPLANAQMSTGQELLDAAIRFYGAQRSGDGANWTLPSGISCFMRDGEVRGLDLAGGWFDAGDHLINTLSVSFAAHRLLKTFDSYDQGLFPDRHDQRYGPANGVPDILDEVTYGLDWLVKAHPSPDYLVHTVGGFKFDHSTWAPCPIKQRGPVEKGGEPRPVDLDQDMEGEVTAQADFAGMAAAALALGGRLIEPFDPDRAGTYLATARSVYALGLERPRTSQGFYGQARLNVEQWQDEMMCAAVELFRSTGEAAYLEDARGFAAEAGANPHALTWAHNHDLCWHSMILAGAGDAVMEPWAKTIGRYRQWVSDDPNLAGLVDTGPQWATLHRAAAVAWSTALFGTLTDDSALQAWAFDQLDYITGNNGYGRSFIVGFGVNPPAHPHHINAFGEAGWDAFRVGGPQAVELKGALVGGPTRSEAGPSQPGYQDIMQDYVGNEVGLSYNAPLVGLIAHALDAGHAVRLDW